MRNDAWIGMIKMLTTFTMDHVRQFILVWTCLGEVHLEEVAEDTIIWKHTTNEEYTTTLVYHAQILGMICSSMNITVWKAWAPPKVKFFACLAIQNSIWTADHLARRV